MYNTLNFNQSNSRNTTSNNYESIRYDLIIALGLLNARTATNYINK